MLNHELRDHHVVSMAVDAEEAEVGEVVEEVGKVEEVQVLRSDL